MVAYIGAYIIHFTNIKNPDMHFRVDWLISQQKLLSIVIDLMTTSRSWANWKVINSIINRNSLKKTFLVGETGGNCNIFHIHAHYV